MGTLRAQTPEEEAATFNQGGLDTFYNEYLLEADESAADVLLTDPPFIGGGPTSDECGPLTPRPTIPPLAQKASSLSFIPIVLINNTNLHDDDVYFVVYGFPVTDCSVDPPTLGTQSFVSFGPAPGGPFVTEGTLIPATGVNVPTTESVSYAFSNIPLTNGQRIIYVPQVVSGNILISTNANLTMLATGAGTIATPNPGLGTDPNYTTVYGALEFSFYPSACLSAPNNLNQLTFDFTCVDYYGLSIYLNLFTEHPLPTIPKNRPSGIYQSRAYTLCKLRNALNMATPASLAAWTGLIQKPGAVTLRVLSPGNALGLATPGFDVDYFDNAAAYGFSWANDVWTGMNAYYINNHLTITVNDGTVYTGKIINGVFTFSSSTSGYTFGIPWINSPTVPSTTTAIFSVEAFFPGMTYTNGSSPPCVLPCAPPAPGTAIAHATEITEYLSAVIPAGLIPGKVDKIDFTGFPPSMYGDYYKPNSHLTPPGSTTGPWFDLYSLGLHRDAEVTGNAVYSYAYDDFLFAQAPPNQQVAPSQKTIDDTTYITIVVGPYSDN